MPIEPLPVNEPGASVDTERGRSSAIAAVRSRIKDHVMESRDGGVAGTHERWGRIGAVPTSTLERGLRFGGAVLLGMAGGLALALMTIAAAFVANIHQDGVGTASAWEIFLEGVAPPLFVWWCLTGGVVAMAWVLDRRRGPTAFGVAYVLGVGFFITPLMVVGPVAVGLGIVRSARERRFRPPSWAAVAVMSAVALLAVVVVAEGARAS